MDRWEIRPSPSGDDPQRHLLLLRGGPADVAAVLKKFGALCGRPTPLDGDEFNLSFVLHKVSPQVREKLDGWFGRMCPAAAPAETPAIPALVPPTLNALPSMPALAPAIPPPPVNPPLPAAKEPLISIGPETSLFASPKSAPPGAEPAITLSAPAEPPKTEPPMTGTASAAAPASLTDELRADLTFETLLVGAYNRFAHAAAMSVVTSPGAMYNPLFLYGVPGTGKSHLLYAIANSMSKGLGSASLLLTSGARLSREVSVAAARGSMAAIDKKVEGSKAIFVDDIHLLAVTDQNRDLLANLFKSFFDRGQQVVITSMYPPKALGTLEEALKFTFSTGWSVDLKIPSPNVQRDLVTAVADRSGSEFNGDEIGQLADKLTMWGYQDLSLWIKRLTVLRPKRAALNQPASLMDLLRLIYEPITIANEEPPISTAGSTFVPPAAPAGAEPLAIIVPSGQEGLGAYAAGQFYDVGGRNGFPRVYKLALMDTYDAMQQVGVPFQIADMCRRAGVTRALIVGPGSDSPMAPRANEFGHALRRILDSANVALGWIPHSRVGLPAHYINAHLDFEK